MAEQIPLWHDTRWLFTTLVALYAAAVATYRELALRWQRQPDVRVFLEKSYSLASTFASDGGDEIIETISVTITNHGFLEMTFEAGCCHFEVDGQRNSIVFNAPIVSPALPATLQHGQSLKQIGSAWDFNGAIQGITGADGVFRVRVRAVDAIQRRFFSEWLDVTTGF